MAAIVTRTFACGDDIVLHLPEELGIRVGATVTFEKIGDVVRMLPVGDSMFVDPMPSVTPTSEEN